MALELERRAIELLGDRAPAWVRADAGQVGPGVHIIDDVEDVNEPTDGGGPTAAADEHETARRKRFDAFTRVADTLRNEGFDRAPAESGAFSATRSAHAGDNLERVTELAREGARLFQRASLDVVTKRSDTSDPEVLGVGAAWEDMWLTAVHYTVDGIVLPHVPEGDGDQPIDRVHIVMDATVDAATLMASARADVADALGTDGDQSGEEDDRQAPPSDS